jgi:hypothetical protein
MFWHTGFEMGPVASAHLSDRRHSIHDRLMGDSNDRDRESRRRPKPLDRPGAVEHDKRGNAVWKWAVDSGRDMLDSTSKLLKRLEVPGLSIDGTDPAIETLSVDRHAGYDPYGTNRPKRPASHSAAPASDKSPQAAPAAKPSAAKPAPESAAPRPSVLERLLRKP